MTSINRQCLQKRNKLTQHIGLAENNKNFEKDRTILRFFFFAEKITLITNTGASVIFNLMKTCNRRIDKALLQLNFIERNKAVQFWFHDCLWFIACEFWYEVKNSRGFLQFLCSLCHFSLLFLTRKDLKNDAASKLDNEDGFSKFFNGTTLLHLEIAKLKTALINRIV